MLTKAQFEKAKGFIQANARQVDRVLFEYEFHDRTAQAVLDELAAFQNADGGFGQAIEPDFRLAASSPMATSVGLQYATAVGASKKHPVVQGAVRYLTETFETEGDYWPAAYPEVNEAPHAPWWHVEAVAPPEGPDWANPSAELTGYLHRYDALVPAELLERTAAKAAAVLADNQVQEFPFYNVMCWERALGSVPVRLAAKIETYLLRTFGRLHPLTAEKLREVHIDALAGSPKSILARLYPQNVGELLDKAIEDQAPDGGWWPTWSWGQYEEAWEVARVEWAGKLTAGFLTVLKRFDKIELGS